MHAVNTAHKISDYAKSTTTGVICNHLFKKHKADWFEACKKFNLQVSGICHEPLSYALLMVHLLYLQSYIDTLYFIFDSLLLHLDYIDT